MRLACLLLLVAGVARAEPEAMSPEAKAHYDRGILLYQDGRYAEAIDELLAGRAIDPRPELDYSLGQSERKRGDCRRANQYFEEYRAAILRAKLLEKVGPADKLIDLCVQEQIASGRAAHEGGDFARAAIALEGALAQPQYLTRAQLAEAYAILATAYVKLDRMRDAEGAFQELLRIDRTHPPTEKCDARCAELYQRQKTPPPITVAARPRATTLDDAPRPRTTTVYGAARVHVDALLFGDLVSIQGGAEVGASFAPLPILDVGAAASLGRNVGGRVSVALHPSRVKGGRLRWYLQARGVVHPVCELVGGGCAGGTGVAIGGGLLAGGTVELGPGRIAAGVVGELYAVPAGYFPYAVLGVIGYEVDLWKPSRVVAAP